MKKNMLTIVVIAVSFINLVLTAVMIFVIVPTSNQTRALLDQVASIIDLELESPDPLQKFELSDLDKVTFTAEITANLKPTVGDARPHYAMFDQISIQVYKKSDAYKTYFTKMPDYEDMIMDTIADCFVEYTLEEATLNKDHIKDDIMEALSGKFGTIDYIIDISFKNIRFQ